jgi:hypothetical protein
MAVFTDFLPRSGFLEGHGPGLISQKYLGLLIFQAFCTFSSPRMDKVELRASHGIVPLFSFIPNAPPKASTADTTRPLCGSTRHS